jgi:hypothetical protein
MVAGTDGQLLPTGQADGPWVRTAAARTAAPMVGLHLHTAEAELMAVLHHTAVGATAGVRRLHTAGDRPAEDSAAGLHAPLVVAGVSAEVAAMLHPADTSEAAATPVEAAEVTAVEGTAATDNSNYC